MAPPKFYRILGKINTWMTYDYWKCQVLQMWEIAQKQQMKYKAGTTNSYAGYKESDSKKYCRLDFPGYNL